MVTSTTIDAAESRDVIISRAEAVRDPAIVSIISNEADSADNDAVDGNVLVTAVKISSMPPTTALSDGYRLRDTLLRMNAMSVGCMEIGVDKDCAVRADVEITISVIDIMDNRSELSPSSEKERPSVDEGKISDVT